MTVPHAEPPAESGLVWLEDAQHRHVTFWVSTADGSPLASQPIEGPLFADGEALWQWVEETVERPVYDEEPASEGNPGEPSGTRPVARGLLRELVSDASVEVVEAPAPGPVRHVESVITLRGLVGPFLFVDEVQRLDAWGAHGAMSERALVWDLRGAGPAGALLTERERASILPEAAERARARLIAEGEDAGVSPELRVDEVELVAIRPAWDPTHGLRVSLQLATSACYACGDGLFSDYTRSAEVELPALPERLAEHGRLPPWAIAAAARVEGARLLGFSVVSRPAPAAILASLRR